MTIQDKLKEYGVSEAVIVEILADCGSDEQCIDDKLEARGYPRILGTSRATKVNLKL